MQDGEHNLSTANMEVHLSRATYASLYTFQLFVNQLLEFEFLARFLEFVEVYIKCPYIRVENGC